MNLKQISGIKQWIMLLMALFWAIGCEAPRENPLDPENPTNSIYSIQGTLLTAEKTPGTLAGASVYWPGENLFTITNENGAFQIRCEKRTDGWLHFSKIGYSADSIFVQWGGLKNAVAAANLNALPVLDSLSIYSSVRNKYSNTEYLLYFEVSITDVDDDIDTIKISCPYLNIDVSLTKQTASHFEARYYDFELELTAFNDVIGREFKVIAVTKSGKYFVVGSSTVLRVIRDEIEVITPINSDTLETKTPLLNWTRFTPGFTFTYTLEIYTDETEPVLQWKKENVSSDDIFMQVDVPLTVTSANDKFFWVIWCIDEYKNKSRSKPAGFTLR